MLLDNAECAESAVLIDMLEPLLELASRDEDYTPSSLVISGGRRLRESLYERRGPMYGALTPVLLSTLTDHEASTFIRAVLPMATAAHVRELGSVLLYKALVRMNSTACRSSLKIPATVCVHAKVLPIPFRVATMSVLS